MITAAEAHAASATVDEVECRRELEIIRRYIGIAIQDGYYWCEIPRRHLTELTIKSLKRLGYKVKGKAPYIISWR